MLWRADETKTVNGRLEDFQEINRSRRLERGTLKKV
jgi:hypothetical protein